MPNITYAYGQTPNANTPDPGSPISILDVRRVFGEGKDNNPGGSDLDDYHGISYWETVYPFRSGKFVSEPGSQLTLQDFYSKTSSDPVIPGKYEDFEVGTPKSVRVPPFRRKVRIEIWGAGGGGGAGDHDTTPATASTGGSSYFTYISGSNNYTITAHGGGGGGGGYRYGNQNGGGGGGGTVSNTANLIGVFTKSNGTAGAGGNAGGGIGGAGGSAFLGSLTSNATYTYSSGGAGGYLRIGYPGNYPGGGGGGGGSSDFQSGKNANPNRAAGGGGGSGAYAKIELTRNQIIGGSSVYYGIGSGGNFATGNMYNGGQGAAGGFRLSWDYDPAQINTQTMLIDQWRYPFGGCAGAGWNDLTICIGTSQFTYAGKTTGANGGIILAVTGAAADYRVAGRMSTSQHTNVTDGYFLSSILFLNDNPLYSDLNILTLRSFTSGWSSAYSNGRDNMAFKITTVFDGTIFKVNVYGDCKGGALGGQIINTVFPTLSY